MLEWILNLEWGIGFVDASNNITVSLQCFFHLLWMYIVIIVCLLTFWMWINLDTFRFKKIILLNGTKNNYSLNFLKIFINTNKSLQTLYIYIEVYLSLYAFIIKGILRNLKGIYIEIESVKEYPKLERNWGFIPLFFVGAASYPTGSLAYSLSPDTSSFVVLKIWANQWYWDFEITAKVSCGLIELGSTSFKKSLLYKTLLDNINDEIAYIDALKNMQYEILSKRQTVNLLNTGSWDFYRLLHTNRIISLPVNIPIKLIITSNDVIHSFAIPALAIKIDAIAGRLSEHLMIIEKPGILFGQCSELCGPYHGYMPLVINACSYNDFLSKLLT